MLKLDISARLFSLTYLLVVFGAQTDGDAAVLTATRMGGICVGVVMSLCLSVLIFPQSATEQAWHLQRSCKFLACMKPDDRPWHSKALFLW